MIVYDLKSELLNEMRDDFNFSLIHNGESLLSMSPFEMFLHFDKKYTVQQWKEFRLNPLVDSWFEEEMSIIIKNKTFDLLRKSGTNNSTATNQALNQLLTWADKKKQTAIQPTTFIYSFVPLSEMEELAPNVEILENIPTEIKDAIVKIR